ncbi:MAG TPA: ABC transporter permease [Dehalococcoidia bacterium]|nr:ABC transporter permease [Dehalococcoidia bacterium]
MAEAMPGAEALREAIELPQRYRSLWGDAARRFSRNRTAMLGLIVILILATMAALAPVIQRHDPTFQNYSSLRESPNGEFWLGTDLLGRDQWSRLVHGARISLSVGVLTEAVALTIGMIVGLTAALGGRGLDNLMMRVTDIAYAFPDLLMLILLLSIFGPSFLMIFFAIGLVSWPTLARLIRGQILSLQQRDFVLAARAMGASRLRIVVTHLLPNTLGPVIVAAVFGIPFAIFAEAALAFIGLGLPPPTPSWGRLVTDGYSAIRSSPHLVLFSTLAIAITMMSFTFIGDGLRDALDPRTR